MWEPQKCFKSVSDTFQDVAAHLVQEPHSVCGLEHTSPLCDEKVSSSQLSCSTISTAEFTARRFEVVFFDAVSEGLTGQAEKLGGFGAVPTGLQ